jgi:hypothetical protein
MRLKEQTIGDIIKGARQSIDDADPAEWSSAVNKNYVQQTISVFDTNDKTDEIEKPAHYNYGKYETIDVIVDTLGEYEAISYCHGNVLKYAIRMWHKGNPEKDIKKAIWYANKMVELLEKTKDKNW